jgi:hypothetical protein
LDLLGFGTWEHSTDINALHINHAQEENIAMRTHDVEIMPIDNHDIHIDEHVSYVLGANIKDCENYDEVKQRLLNHIEEHKIMQKQNDNI